MFVKKRTQYKNESGYTLTELVIVIAILGVLAAAITPNILSRFNAAKIRSAAIQAGTLAAAMDEFFVDTNRYPTPEEGVGALLSVSTSISGWSGPYVRSTKTLDDPWGNRFVIVASTSDNEPPSVVSYGSDGVSGGTGTAEDISYP